MLARLLICCCFPFPLAAQVDVPAPPNAAQALRIAETTCLKPWFDTASAIRDAEELGWLEVDPMVLGVGQPQSTPQVWTGWLGRYLDEGEARFIPFFAIFSESQDPEDGRVQGCSLFLQGVPVAEFMSLFEADGFYKLAMDESTGRYLQRTYTHEMIGDMTVEISHDALVGDGLDLWISTLRFEAGKLPPPPRN